MLLEPRWISDAFELREPEFYKIVKTVTCDDEIRKCYTAPVGRCNQLTTFEESKCEKKPKSALIVPVTYISNKEPSKKSYKKPKR